MLLFNCYSSSLKYETRQFSLHTHYSESICNRKRITKFIKKYIILFIIGLTKLRAIF